VGALGVLELEVLVEVSLLLVEGLVAGGAVLHVEMLIEQGPVEAFDEAVGVKPADSGSAVLSILEFEEGRVGGLSGRLENSRRLSERTVRTYMPRSSKKGRKRVFMWRARKSGLQRARSRTCSSVRVSSAASLRAER